MSKDKELHEVKQRRERDATPSGNGDAAVRRALRQRSKGLNSVSVWR